MPTPRVFIATALLLIALPACGGGTDSSPSSASSPASASSSVHASTKPTPTPVTILADDFSDPTTGWDRTGTAQYRDGRLVVGQSSPAAILVPSPNGFDGPAVVTATGSIDGAGEAGIGLFCAGSIDPTTSAYVAFVDPQRASATIGRLSAAGPQVMAAGKHIDQVVSLDQPFELQLKCARVGGTERLSFAVGGKVIAVGADPDPLEGPVGGLYFEYTKGGTVGIFDDFDLVPMPGA